MVVCMPVPVWAVRQLYAAAVCVSERALVTLTNNELNAITLGQQLVYDNEIKLNIDCTQFRRYRHKSQLK